MSSFDFEKISRWMLAYARRRGVDEEDASDLVQEAIRRYLEVESKLEQENRSGEESIGVKSWLQKVLDNLIVDCKRGTQKSRGQQRGAKSTYKRLPRSRDGGRSYEYSRETYAGHERAYSPDVSIPDALTFVRKKGDLNYPKSCLGANDVVADAVSEWEEAYRTLFDDHERSFPLLYRGLHGRGLVVERVKSWLTAGFKMPRKLYAFYRSCEENNEDRKAIARSLRCTAADVRRDMSRLHRWVDELRAIKDDISLFVTLQVTNVATIFEEYDICIEHQIAVQAMRFLRIGTIKSIVPKLWKDEVDAPGAIELMNRRYARRRGCSGPIFLESILREYPNPVAIQFDLVK